MKLILSESKTTENGCKDNYNSIVLGLPGSGKTRNFVLPNILNSDCSSIILDPKGELYKQCKTVLEERGIEVKCLDFCNPGSSPNHYNPFKYIESDNDILAVSEALVSPNERDPYWPNNEKILLNAVVSMLIENNKTVNFETINAVQSDLMQYILNSNNGTSNNLPYNHSGIAEKRKLPSGIMLPDYDEYARESNKLFSRQYMSLKPLGNSPKTLTSIDSCLCGDYNNLLTDGIINLTAFDDIDFKSIANKKTALFVKSSDTERSLDKLIGLFFTQAFQQLCRYADSFTDSHLPVHVHFYLDDFGTNLKIQNFDSYIAGIRSREISCSVILQSEGQLKKMYGEAYNVILNSCRYYIFFGGIDLDTCKTIAEMADFSVQDVSFMPKNKIIIMETNAAPRFYNKYNIEKDKLYIRSEQLKKGDFYFTKLPA